MSSDNSPSSESSFAPRHRQVCSGRREAEAPQSLQKREKTQLTTDPTPLAIETPGDEARGFLPSWMKLSFLNMAAISTVVCCTLGACVSVQVSDQDQSDSIGSHIGSFFKPEEIGAFFGSRTAVLLSSDQIELEPKEETISEESQKSTFIKTVINIKKGGNLSFGTAAAIDSRGYFLTAAHCVDDSKIYALYADSGGDFAVEKIRVVWKGRPEATDFDFAVFHVAIPPYLVFQWSDSFEEGETVFSAGATIKQEKDDEPTLSFSLDPFAGKLAGAETKFFKGISYQLVNHRSPIRKGNSGGPLINKKGNLIGINYAGIYSSWRARQWGKPLGGEAIRPDRSWLEKIIEEDQAKLD